MSESPDTEYTPATTQVRYAYVTFNRDSFIASTAEHEREFDRWLADLIRRERAEAWAEGVDAWGEVMVPRLTAVNPYIREADAAAHIREGDE